jgi:hypothetical protein
MLTLLAALAAVSTNSGITYLTCTTTQEGQQAHWSITLNEPQGIADYITPIGLHRQARAQFTVDAVYFIGFKLSRVDLTMERHDESYEEHGSCRVAPQVNRAF